MKFFLITLLFITNAFATDICDYNETWEFEEALEQNGIKPYKKTINLIKLTFVEKQMIHLTVTQAVGVVTREEALEIFGDYYKGKEGFNAGEIIYYKIKGKEYALVHSWPGDNEVGAYFEMKGSAYKQIAVISDSFIDCK